MASVVADATSTPASNYSSAFCLLIRSSDNHALMTVEGGGKYAMLGGKKLANEDDFTCVARKAFEKTGGALSDSTIELLKSGNGLMGGKKIAYYKAKAIATKVLLPSEVDDDVDDRFVKKSAERLGATDVDGLAWVPLDKIEDWSWRAEHVKKHHISVLLSQMRHIK